MTNFFSTTNSWRKPLLFGISGAAGCLLAAMLGELWLGATVPPPPPPPPPPPKPAAQAVVLVLDTSYSMENGPLEEMKRAASAYVQRQDLSAMRIGVVCFDDGARVVSPLSRDRNALASGINALGTNGLTRMDLGLQSALSVFENTNEKRNVLLFTDGLPQGNLFFDAVSPTRAAASQIQSSGARLLAIAASGSDRDFLAELTGRNDLVFEAGQGNFGEAFEKAEQVITPPIKTSQIVESKATENADFSGSLFRIAVWTAFLGMGLSLALVLAQKRYTRRALGLDDAIGAVGGALIGLVAGAASQAGFALAADDSAISSLARVGAWAILGGALGAGMAAFVPNLKMDRAAPAGAVGGVLGALGFLAASQMMGDVAGRWMGAALIGLLIGAMVALAEVAFRRAWLHVSYGERDFFDVSLGVRPIGVGSDGAACKIFARGAAPVAASYAISELGRVYVQDASGAREDLSIGDKRTFGNASIEVRGEMELKDAPKVPAPGILPPLNQTPNQTMNHHLPNHPAGSTPGWSTPGAPGIPNALAQNAVWSLLHPAFPLLLPTFGGWQIGRAHDNHIVISDPGISSRHALLDAAPHALTLLDLGSTNGTLVNGYRIAPHAPVVLRPGDRVQMGSSEYVVHFE